MSIRISNPTFNLCSSVMLTYHAHRIQSCEWSSDPTSLTQPSSIAICYVKPSLHTHHMSKSLQKFSLHSVTHLFTWVTQRNSSLFLILFISFTQHFSLRPLSSIKFNLFQIYTLSHLTSFNFSLSLSFI